MTIENKTSILGIPVWKTNLQSGDILYDFDSRNGTSKNRLLRMVGANVTNSIEVLDPDTISLQWVIKPGASGKQLCKETDNKIDVALSNSATISRKIFSESADPTFRYIQRWEEAIPEFNVGHFQRLKTFIDGEIETDAIVFAGDYIGGCFIEGAFTSGMEAALRLEGKMYKD